MSQSKEQQTRAVFSHHIQALRARDLDAILEDYAEDSVAIVNIAPEPIRGLAAIRAFWTMSLEIFTPEVLANLEFSRQSFDGEIAYTVWSAGATIPFGTDTFVIRDGKIAVQTAAAIPGQAS